MFRFIRNLNLLSTKRNEHMFFRQKASNNEQTSSIKMIKLKNGSEAPEPAVITTMISLESLMDKNPIAFYEFVQKCRDPNHEMWGNTKEAVAKLALINNNSVHDITKNVVLSAVQGEDLEMALSSPVEKNSGLSNKM